MMAEVEVVTIVVGEEANPVVERVATTIVLELSLLKNPVGQVTPSVIKFGLEPLIQ